MSDFTQQVFGQINLVYKDLGDGTHAPVVALAGEADVSSATGVAKVAFKKFTSTVNAQILNIPEGAFEVSIANTGASNATFSTTSMAPAFTILRPVTDPDGVTLNFVAPSGYALEAMSVGAPVGVTIDYMVIRP